jgi:hypothetical protein
MLGKLKKIKDLPQEKGQSSLENIAVANGIAFLTELTGTQSL